MDLKMFVSWLSRIIDISVFVYALRKRALLLPFPPRSNVAIFQQPSRLELERKEIVMVWCSARVPTTYDEAIMLTCCASFIELTICPGEIHRPDGLHLVCLLAGRKALWVFCHLGRCCVH